MVQFDVFLKFSCILCQDSDDSSSKGAQLSWRLPRSLLGQDPGASVRFHFGYSELPWGGSESEK